MQTAVERREEEGEGGERREERGERDYGRRLGRSKANTNGYVLFPIMLSSLQDNFTSQNDWYVWEV